MSIPADRDRTEDNMEVDFQDPLEGIDVEVNNSPDTDAEDSLNYIDTYEPFGNTGPSDSLRKYETEELILDFVEEDLSADQLKLEEIMHESEREPVIDLDLEESTSSVASPIILLEPEDINVFSEPPPNPKRQRTQDGIDLDAGHSIDAKEKLKIESYFNIKAKQFSHKADAIEENMATVKNVLYGCKNIHSIHIKLPDTNAPQSKIEYLEHLTKANLEYLVHTIGLKDSNIEKKIVSHLVCTMKPIPVNVQQFIYDDIRTVFVEFYVKERAIPTKNDFIKTLFAMRSLGNYTRIFMETLIENNLIKYHHLPKLNRYILTENPELSYKRHIFLRQISESRSRKECIMYVSIKVAQLQSKIPKYCAIAGSAAGLIHKCEYIKYKERDNEFENPEIVSWLQHELIPKIETGWTIHLTTIRKKDTTPTAFSSKIEMLDWLMQRKLPYDANFHAAQLYTLIKLHKEKPKCFYEDLFTCAGFRVINCPIEYESLDFFRNITGTDELKDGMRLQQRLIVEEKQMMKEDADMDRIVNNLFEMVKNGDVKANDFPNGSQGTKSDNVYAHIGNIIV